MKTYKDLVIQKNNFQELKEILSQVKNRLSNGWILKEDLIEKYAQNLSKDKSEIGCFESPIISNTKGSVWFIIWNDELKISNIIPSLSNSLTFDDYNKILDQFYKDCLEKILIGKDVNVIITEADYNLKDILGDNAYEALNKWETLCNRSTGNINSFDFERWANFLSISFNENSELTSDLLARWLVEERKWQDNELVSRIAIDFEYGLSILEYYAKHN